MAVSTSVFTCYLKKLMIRALLKRIRNFFYSWFRPGKLKVFKKARSASGRVEPYVTRSNLNPLLEPTGYGWEAQGVLNPAAICLDGKVHLLYRAVGSDGMSTIGYACSSDGLNFEERLPYPVYWPRESFESTSLAGPKTFAPATYTSGGGWAGCEDPKICQIGDRLFLTYVAFGGWESVRIALSSIAVEDFLNRKWRWTKPVLCTKPGVIAKSGGLFPGKINGRYVFFQRVFPNILIDYLDHLRFDEDKWPAGEFAIAPQVSGWDSRKISFGSVPLKTKYGWLVITHGVDDQNDGQYHLGAMLLDLNQPERVLYRSREPLLSPDLWYENDWKPGVVYPCGAVVKDRTLFIYYGGGDKYVCAASAPFEQFMNSLRSDEHLPPLKINRLAYK